MADISCRSYSLDAGRLSYQTANRSRKSSSGNSFKIQMAGNEVHIEQTFVGNDIDWNEMNKIPGKYALKDGGFLSHHWGDCGAEYKLYHAAESTEERPVVVARGVDEYGNYFEEKIDVKQINPYNTSTLELEALEHFKPNGGIASNPYDCIQGQEKGLRERCDYVAGAQRLIAAWNRIGYAGQAAQWSAELNFLLGYTENTAGPVNAKSGYQVDAAFFESISEEYKRNLELYVSAAKERLAAGMAKRCSEQAAGMFWEK